MLRFSNRELLFAFRTTYDAMSGTWHFCCSQPPALYFPLYIVCSAPPAHYRSLRVSPAPHLHSLSLRLLRRSPALTLVCVSSAPLHVRYASPPHHRAFATPHPRPDSSTSPHILAACEGVRQALIDLFTIARPLRLAFPSPSLHLFNVPAGTKNIFLFCSQKINDVFSLISFDLNQWTSIKLETEKKRPIRIPLRIGNQTHTFIH